MTDRQPSPTALHSHSPRSKARPPRPHRVHPPETPDTQEALYVPDGVWEVSEEDGAGSRTATTIEQQIETDGLTVNEDNVVVPHPDSEDRENPKD